MHIKQVRHFLNAVARMHRNKRTRRPLSTSGDHRGVQKLQGSDHLRAIRPQNQHRRCVIFACGAPPPRRMQPVNTHLLRIRPIVLCHDDPLERFQSMRPKLAAQLVLMVPERATFLMVRHTDPSGDVAAQGTDADICLWFEQPSASSSTTQLRPCEQRIAKSFSMYADGSQLLCS